MDYSSNRTVFEELDDASLVAASLAGDRGAYGKIVTRYQRLLCSLAYSSLGDLAASEDVAQEALIEGWKKLGTLKDPEKLKSWLCSILRFKAGHYRRSESRRPVRDAENLEEMQEIESGEIGIEEQAMNEEEKALLWQALERIPENYREPLVLYYREHRSVEHVAYELDLSESAVKQRLSRGRKILQEQVMRFVEGALAKSAPGSVFTAGVLAAIATIAPPAKAAGAGATAAAVGSAFKWASVAAFLGSVSGLISTVFALRANFDQSRTQSERRYIVKSVCLYLGAAAALVVGLLGLRQLAVGAYEHAGYYAFFAQALVVGFAAFYVMMTFRLMSGMQRLRGNERLAHPDQFAGPADQLGSARRSFKSRWSLLGVPLVHVKFNITDEGDGPAFAWIAGGEKAYGLLFAWGGIAVAPVSVGIVALGIFPVAAVSLGIFSMGTAALGFIAMGASAVGYKAYASLSAMGWESAFSQGFAVAKQAAIGPIALASETNNEAAAEMANLTAVGQSYVLVLGIVALLVIAPAVWYARQVRKRMRRE